MTIEFDLETWIEDNGSLLTDTLIERLSIGETAASIALGKLIADLKLASNTET
jgi:hypothetical protein